MSEQQNTNFLPCIEVALDIPMRQTFSYRFEGKTPHKGVRVRVPFGRRTLVGVVLGLTTSPPENIKLKTIEAVLDEQAIFSASLISLIEWTARYYHHPPGEVWRSAMPKVLRKGLDRHHGLLEDVYTIHDLPPDWALQLKRAPIQASLIRCLTENRNTLSKRAIYSVLPNARGALQSLIGKQWLIKENKLPLIDYAAPTVEPSCLTEEQSRALTVLSADMDTFQCHVLEGVTGSGKTEVYFGLIDKCIEAGKQSLIMVPEIALTDQLLSRFTARFGGRVVHMHSAMSDTQRHNNWWQLSTGIADIVLCTRSGVFLEFKQLGLIIVDEEHDGSFKQHEGLRYHARSVAIKRAQMDNIPIILGSATPALDTFHNVEQGRYPGARLCKRIGARQLPDVELIDLNHYSPEGGLSSPAMEALKQTLDNKQQALVFINRRGYAPVLYCPSCQWTAQCKRCDAQLTTHSGQRSLQCHHCGIRQVLPEHCEACGRTGLIELGEGTQKIEERLCRSFPKAHIQRFDRDNLNSAQKLQQAMARVHSGEIDILVGTQLLAKGHDFSGVNLVLVVNADQGLHSIDFRAPEQLVQQLIQVAGRAGRGEQKGRVLIQSYFPEHPYLQAVREHDYRQFAKKELAQRALAGFPPYSYMALWRARSTDATFVMKFLQSVAGQGKRDQPADTICFDPVQSPMFRRGGEYHAQLLISAKKRSDLHRWLSIWIDKVTQSKASKRLHWSIDIDPVSLF